MIAILKKSYEMEYYSHTCETNGVKRKKKSQQISQEKRQSPAGVDFFYSFPTFNTIHSKILTMGP
jgi:hypothetical protein